MSEPEIFNKKDAINSILKRQICAAAKGDREATEELLAHAIVCMQGGKLFPEPLKEYLEKAFTAIIKREDADRALLLKHSTPGGKRTYADRQRREEIAYFIQKKNNEGISLEEAYAIVENDKKTFGIKEGAAKKIYYEHRGMANFLILMESRKNKQ